jgi:hypothetical protein
VIVASPSHRQSGEFVRKAAGMVRRLGIKPQGDGDNDISLELPNRSRIVGLPGVEGTVRGFSAVSLMLIDEASRVDDGMYQALRPMLARPVWSHLCRHYIGIRPGHSVFSQTRGGLVAAEHAVPEARVFLPDVAAWRRCVA